MRGKARTPSELAAWLAGLAKAVRLVRSLPEAMELCERVIAHVDASPVSHADALELRVHVRIDCTITSGLGITRIGMTNVFVERTGFCQFVFLFCMKFEFVCANCARFLDFSLACFFNEIWCASGKSHAQMKVVHPCPSEYIFFFD